MKKNVTLTNVIASILLQVVLVIDGFLVPKIIIATFGSEVNGLVSSISQLLSYITLVEGGITTVVMAHLYKPLLNNEDKKTQTIINTSAHFFRKIGIIFAMYSIVLALIAPIIYSKDGFSYWYIFTLTLILAISLLIQYMMSLSLKCLLQADKKVFFVSIVQIVIRVINIILTLLCVIIIPEIHILKLLVGLTYIIQPILYRIYINKNYDLPKTKDKDESLLRDRWDGFANNLAYFIHMSTDITVLTFLTNLVTVSVYSVYSLVTAGIKAFLGAINTGVFASLGHIYASGNYKKLQQKFNQYETLYLVLVFFCTTLAILLITPFVIVYVGNANTNNEYMQPLFGVLLSISTMLDLIRAPHVNLAYAANKMKDMVRPCFVEAGINIIVSIVLVLRFGLIGVAIGTIFAMLYRVIYQVSLSKKIMHLRQIKTYRTIVLLMIPLVLSVLLCNLLFKINFQQLTVVVWIKYAIMYGVVSALIFSLFGLCFFRESITTVIKKTEKMIKHKKR